MRCVASRIASKNIDEVKELLRNFFTVLLNEAGGCDEIGEPTSCEKAKWFLRRKIAGIQQIELDDAADDQNYLEEDTQNETESEAETTIYTDIESIYNECVQESRKKL